MTRERENQPAVAPAFVESQSGVECLGLARRLAPAISKRALRADSKSFSSFAVCELGWREGEEGRDVCISQDVLAEYSIRPLACGNQKAPEGTAAHLCTSWQALQNRDRNWTHLGKIPTVPGPLVGSAALWGPESRALQSQPCAG